MDMPTCPRRSRSRARCSSATARAVGPEAFVDQGVRFGPLHQAVGQLRRGDVQHQVPFELRRRRLHAGQQQPGRRRQRSARALR